MPAFQCKLDYQTAGESHGPALITTITGLPAGLPLDLDLINGELRRRQGGYGRGGRQKLETDVVEFLCGVRLGKTIGAPLVLKIANRDSRLDDLERTPPVHRPRPGHADLVGVDQVAHDRLPRDAGARQRPRDREPRRGGRDREVPAPRSLRRRGLRVRAPDPGCAHGCRGHRGQLEGPDRRPRRERHLHARRGTTEAQRAHIRAAKENKDTVGGHVEAHVFGCPPGIGSSMDWTTKLDARIAYAVMGIQAFKAVQIGAGVRAGETLGGDLHDPIAYDASTMDTHTLGFERPSNNAGGTEGGMTNGMPVVVTGTMKPIATLLKGLPSVDLNTKESDHSQYERSDVCAVSAASVVMENAVAFEVARCFTDKFGGDSLTEIRVNYENYLRLARSLPLDPPASTLA
jgi:chorismate synthase